MSKRVDAIATCPKCSHRFGVELYRSLWTEYPENLALILDDQLNVFQCPKCIAQFEVDFAVMAVNKVKGYSVWFEPIPDPGIDEELPQYAALFGPDSYYVRAPRIADWAEFKRAVVQFESGERPGGTVDTRAFEREESPIVVPEAELWAEEGLAERFLEQLVARLAVENEWSIRNGRSIEWWSGPYRQQVWMETDPVNRIAIQIRTDFARVKDPAYIGLIKSFSKFHSIAGFCRKPDDQAFWQLGSKLYVTPQNAEATCLLAQYVLAIQARHAFLEGGGLMRALRENGKDRAIQDGASGHPQSGAREETAPGLVALVDNLRAGNDDVHAVNDWFHQATDFANQTDYVLRTIDEEEGDFSYEYPFPRATSRLTGNVSMEHRTLGPSIGVLSIFHALPNLDTAVAAQEFELDAANGIDVLGSWQEGGDGFAHMSVVPYALIRAGFGYRAFFANLERSSWITEDLLGYSWEDNLAEAQEFKKRSIDAFLAAVQEEEDRRNRPGFFKRIFGKKG